MGKNKIKLEKHPYVSICTPTFNRRPFWPMIIKCFEKQDYPKDKLEWIIIDDGTDKIEDLVKDIPQVKYFKYDEKMTLGKKRNLSNQKSTGEIIVYMDDDDYYPADRVSHAVATLRKSKALCAGSSAMFMYFKHINKVYRCGPYGPNHATAATFAFKRQLLDKTRFEENSCVAEEKKFLKDYTIPFVQLDPMKSIFVVSHDQNSFDKKTLLDAEGKNPNMTVVPMEPKDFIKEPDILKFFIDDIEEILKNYEPGSIANKPDVTNQINKIKSEREAKMKEQMEYQKSMQELALLASPQMMQAKLAEQTAIIQNLTQENGQMKDKIKYLEERIRQFIIQQVEQKKKEMQTPSPSLPAPPSPEETQS